MATATGTFETKSTPQAPYDSADGINLARISISKIFSGDIVGNSIVEMIGAMTSVKGSAGYVAVERVIGAVHGKTGTFVLQHSGTMNRTVASLSVTVVPDSGTGDLAGISGSMKIDITAGGHFYAFEYSL